MKKSLLKKPWSVDIHYKDGDFSHNLTGKDFVVDVSVSPIQFGIDLSSNVTANNKRLGVNSYSDSMELLRDHDRLSEVRIRHQTLVKNFLDIASDSENLAVVLTLMFGTYGERTFHLNVFTSESEIKFHL